MANTQSFSMQDERELHNLNELSDFQKEVVTMLKSIGYQYKYNKVYQFNDRSVPVNVDHIERLEDLYVFALGKGRQEMIWEIKTLLQVS
jgi:hypothetical protein